MGRRKLRPPYDGLGSKQEYFLIQNPAPKEAFAGTGGEQPSRLEDNFWTPPVAAEAPVSADLGARMGPGQTYFSLGHWQGRPCLQRCACNSARIDAAYIDGK